MRWRELWCLLMPWHKTRIVKRYGLVLRTRCERCGIEWGLHHGEHIALPWRHVVDVYAEFDRLEAEYRP